MSDINNSFALNALSKLNSTTKDIIPFIKQINNEFKDFSQKQQLNPNAKEFVPMFQQINDKINDMSKNINNEPFNRINFDSNMNEYGTKRCKSNITEFINDSKKEDLKHQMKYIKYKQKYLSLRKTHNLY